MIFAKVIVISLFILSFNPITAVLACPKGKPKSTDYIRRDNNRCEGIKAELLSGNSLNLISIATHKLDSYGDELTIKIPKIPSNKQPQVVVKSLGDDYHYQLDNFSLLNDKTQFRFSWSSYVLKTKEIPLNSVRGLATYNFGSQSVYVPVIFGKPSDNYEFVFYSERRVKFTSFKIMNPSQKQVYITNSPNPKSGENIFTWDASNTPAGRYELNYIVNIERNNQPSERIEKRIIFEHNPQWLK